MLKRIFLTLLFLTTLSQITEAEMNIPITEQNEEARQVLTTNVIELMGPDASAEFYYEIENEIEEGEYFVQFNIEHSDLLVEPSSVTLYIDNTPMKSYPLTKPLKTIKYTLPQDSLTEGTHTIKLAYSGYVLQGICPAQDSNANWMKINIDSFINVPFSSASAAYLNHYPEKFQQDTQVIVPQNATLATLEAALEIAQYLPDAMVVEEQDVKKLSSSTVVVGVKEDFQTTWGKTLLPDSTDGLHLATSIVENKGNYSRVLVAIASDEEALANYRMLTTTHLVDQLVGKDMQITQLPNIEKVQLDDTVTIEELGLSSFTLNSAMTKTNTYFYYLPMSKYQLQNPSVTINFKRSYFISEKETESALSHNAELLVYLNEVPHSIDLQSYSAEKLESVTIPFDINTIKDSQLLSVRFEANGLVQKNPCFTTDRTNWVYIDESSQVNLPTTDDAMDQDVQFKQFPYPFMEANETLTIVKAPDVTLEELQNVYNSLALESGLNNIRLVEEADEEMLAQGHVIFIGNTADNELLTSESNVIVGYKNGKVDLAAEGFVETPYTTYAYVQENPWNDRYAMLVLDRMSVNTPYVKEQTLQFLRDNDSDGTILVEQYELVTNEDLLQKDSSDKANESTNWVYTWITALVVFVIAAVIGMIYFNRRKKKMKNN